MNANRVTLLNEYIQKDPSDPFNYYALAMEYYEANPTQSIKLLKNLLIDHPAYLPTYFKAAHLLWEAEKWEEADQVFQKGIALATKQNDQKAEKELKSAYLNFQFEQD